MNRSQPSFVLVGPLADAKTLSAWAHSEFRRNEGVAFIGVDSGTRILEASGLPASISIGDMDGKGMKGFRPSDDALPTIRLPKKKERSDLAFALELCISLNAAEVFAIGFQGGRVDHELAVHLDLSEASRQIPVVVSLGVRGAIHYLTAKHAPLALDRAKTSARLRAFTKSARAAARWVSVFPIGAPARGVRLAGLRFQPPGGILSVSSQGLSNEVRGTKLRIDVARGTLAIFFPS
jgi:thiamine pyrophosphokinase